MSKAPCILFGLAVSICSSPVQGAGLREQTMACLGHISSHRNTSVRACDDQANLHSKGFWSSTLEQLLSSSCVMLGMGHQ